MKDVSETLTPLIDIQDLTVRHGIHLALDRVNLSIRPGEIVTIVGPNGSGKTTLLRALLGALVPDAGRVRIAPGLRIGYVPQKLTLDRTLPLTVARFLGLRRRTTSSEITQSLARVGAEALTGKQMSDLSGGQFQRVMLARALLEQPQLLVLDEPTTGLDQPGSAEFYRIIEEVRHTMGCAVLLVSHELHVVMAASDRVICLNGHVCCHGAPDVVASAPEYRALFGTGTGGALALYRHDHDHHHHDHSHDHGHDHDHHHHDHSHDHGHDHAHDHVGTS